MFCVNGSAGAQSVAVVFLLLALGSGPPANTAFASDQPKPGAPADARARKTFAEAIDWYKHGNKSAALDDYRKANKQDGGHCGECLNRAYTLALEIGDYKTAESVVRDWLQQAQSDPERATMHFHLAMALQREGISGKKDKPFVESCDEFKTALQLDPRFTAVHYALGTSLAFLHQDDAARAEFSTFLAQDTDNPVLHQRAQRYVERVELARATMAPPFSLTTLDGRQISLDSLAGKVVLIDFWATWCVPCREALPHIREVARRFAGQPLVILSVSLDDDDAKWRDFVAKNGMNWLQYRDGRFTGPIATRFAVNAIPATFSIDADGVLEDQRVGDADIEGKLKKMVARAVEVANRKPAALAARQPSGGGN